MERGWCQEGFVGISHGLPGHTAAPGHCPHHDAPRQHLGVQGTTARKGWRQSWDKWVLASGCPDGHRAQGASSVEALPRVSPWPGHVLGGQVWALPPKHRAKSRSDLAALAGMGRKAGTDPHGAGTGQERGVGRCINHPDLLQKMSPAGAAGEAELVVGG